MKNLEHLSQIYYKQILLLTFFIALILRFVYLPNNSISFAYDQGRDAFIVQDLIKGNLKILGPPVSGIPGLFHGVLYYYIIAPAYLIGNGNPAFVAYFLSFISSLGILSVFYLTKILTKKFFPSLLSSLFFAVSFELTQYSNLLTNASMGVWFVPIIYISILLGSPILLGLSFGLAVQSELALLYHLVPILVLVYKKFNFKKYLLFFTTFAISTLSFIISEFKFGFQGLNGLKYLILGTDGITKAKNFSDYLITIFDQLSLTFSYTIFPVNIVFGGLVGFLIVYYYFNKNENTTSKIFLWYVFGFIFALPFGGWNMRHLLVGIAPIVCVMLAIFINENIDKYRNIAILSILIILIFNILKIKTENVDGQTIFPLQKDLVLSKEIEAIDYTYKKANGEPFSISTLTSPLYVNTLWSYLYTWYGQQKYGYVPSFIGRDQIGQVGNVLKKDITKKHFYIQEPTYGIPEIYVKYALGDEDSYSDLIESVKIGDIMVQDRIYKK